MNSGELAERLLQVFGDLHVNHEAMLAPTLAERIIEGHVHELAHAVVMGVDVLDPEFIGPRRIRRVADEISAMFKGMRGYASDLSECEAIAIELHVLRFLGVDVDAVMVCRYARDGMKTGELAQGDIAERTVRVVMPTHLVLARAFTVIGWIAHVCTAASPEA